MNNDEKTFALVRYGLLLKWALMLVTIFWFMVYRLSEQGTELPGFVYVNF